MQLLFCSHFLGHDSRMQNQMTILTEYIVAVECCIFAIGDSITSISGSSSIDSPVTTLSVTQSKAVPLLSALAKKNTVTYSTASRKRDSVTVPTTTTSSKRTKLSRLVKGPSHQTYYRLANSAEPVLK